MGTLRAKVAGVWQDIGGAASAVEPGRIKATVSTVVPVDWLAFGQTVAGAQTLYPELWAAVPVAWQSGADLVLPAATDCALLGGGTLGAVGGSNSLTLAAANLPAHAHTLAHTHSIAHDHASFNVTGTTNSAGAHDHVFQQDNVVGTATNIARGVATAWNGSPFIAAGAHDHNVDISINPPAFTGTSGASSAPNTGNAGSGTPFDTTPRHLRVNWVIKT